MADVPRDPRQLARDILSGKIKIEDLARERQRQTGGGGDVGGGQMPAKIPLPRPVARPAPVPQRPMTAARPPVVRAPSSPVPLRTGRQAPPMPAQRGPRMEARLPERPKVEMPSKEREEVEVPRGQAQAYAQTTDIRTGPGPAAGRLRKGMRLREMLKDRESLRQGIVLAEILGKPVALRE